MRITRSTPLLVVAALGLGACGNPTRSDAGALAELAQRQHQWQGQQLHAYTFDYQYSFGGGGESARVTVQADTVAGVVDLSSDPAFAIHGDEEWPTIDALFVRAGHALEEANANVSVTYDPQLGYPTLIAISPRQPTPGGGSTTAATNLQQLQ